MSKSKRDLVANVARLREHMDRHRLAAVVARSGQNFTYLSGLAYPGTLARHLDLPDSVRGILLVWPRNGEPVVVLNNTAPPAVLTVTVDDPSIEQFLTVSFDAPLIKRIVLVPVVE